MINNRLCNNINRESDILAIFNNSMFKKEMEINLKQILLESNIQCSLLFNLNSKECFTNGKIINIGILDEFKDLKNFEICAIIKALVGHEASHIRWSSFKDLENFHSIILDSNYNTNFSLSLANIFEDSRIERLLCNDLKGYSKYIQFLNLKFVYKDGNLHSNSVLTNMVTTILFLSKIGVYPLNFKDVFNEEEQLFIVDIVEPLVKKSLLANSHKEVLDICYQLIKILSDKFSELFSEDLSDELNDIVEQNVNPCYSTSESESVIERDLNALNFDFNKEVESVSNAHLNVFKMDLNASDNNIITASQNFKVDELISVLENRFNKEFNEIFDNSKENVVGLETNIEDTYFKNIDLDSINGKYDLDKLKEPNFKYEYISDSFMPYPNNLLFQMQILEKQFKMLLKNDSYYLKNQRKGKIDTSKLWKISSVYDKYVFEKKYDTIDSKYAVYILIDLSGSMDSTYKYKEAINTALIIEGSLANLNNVEVKTVGFNYSGKSRLRIFKDFKEKKSRLANALSKNYTGETNRDGFAIRVALDDLKKHSAENTLLIIISDGRPSWGGESYEESMLDVKNAVHEGRKYSTIMSVLINEGPIRNEIKECFHYMYEDKGTIMVDIKNHPEHLMENLVVYLKYLFKKR